MIYLPICQMCRIVETLAKWGENSNLNADVGFVHSKPTFSAFYKRIQIVLELVFISIYTNKHLRNQTLHLKSEDIYIVERVSLM